MHHGTPPDFHDVAAFALDEPSMAHGFYTPGLEERPDYHTDDQQAKLPYRTPCSIGGTRA